MTTSDITIAGLGASISAAAHIGGVTDDIVIAGLHASISVVANAGTTQGPTDCVELMTSHMLQSLKLSPRRVRNKPLLIQRFIEAYTKEEN